MLINFQKIIDFVLKRNKYYFFCYEVSKIDDKKTNIPKEVVHYMKKFCFRKLKKLKYFEPYVSKNTGKTFLIWGTVNKNEKNQVNRNVMIFWLELYAELNSNKIKVSTDFKLKEKEIKNNKLKIYTVKKFYA